MLRSAPTASDLLRSRTPGAWAANLIDERQRVDIVRNACPGAGACGGMYTANTMACAAEALGMTLPYSSSHPAEDPLKLLECRAAGLCAPALLKTPAPRHAGWPARFALLETPFFLSCWQACALPRCSEA